MENEKEKEKPKELSKDLQGKFSLKGCNPGLVDVQVGSKRKEVDFSTMSLAEAEKLFEAGCKNLVRVESKPTATTPGGAKN